MSGGYRHQVYSILNGLLPDTNKPPAGLYRSHFSDKPGTLFLLGVVCTTPSLDSIEFSAYNTSFFPLTLPEILI